MSNFDVYSTFVFYIAPTFENDVEPISVVLSSHFQAIYTEGADEQNRICPNMIKRFFSVKVTHF